MGAAPGRLPQPGSGRRGGRGRVRDEVPDDAGLVVGVEEVLQRHGGEELLAIRRPEPRSGNLSRSRVSCGGKIAQDRPPAVAS